MLAFYRCLLWIIDFVFYKIWINLIRNSFRFVRDVDLRTCTIHRHYDRPFTIYSIFLTYFSQSNENIGFYCCSDLVANDGNKAVSFIQHNYLLSESNKINNWNMRYFQQIFEIIQSERDEIIDFIYESITTTLKVWHFFWQQI